MRLAALLYAAAFASIWTQVIGLFGSAGIAPVADFLERAQVALGSEAFWRLPTVFWLNASDPALHAVCATGVLLALTVILGYAQRIALAALWLFYLSIVSVGDVFLGFQWDALLLETGLLAVFFAPRGLRPGTTPQRQPSRVALWLLRWLLFRLVFLSGAVKLLSGDATWRDLSALEYHYFSQPLPNVGGYLAHQLPGWWHKVSCAVMFAIELGAPLLIFGPRRARHVACGAIALLMLLIVATGNYGFFEPLTLALCVTLLDDKALRGLVPKRWRSEERAPGLSVSPAIRTHNLRRTTTLAFAALALVMTSTAAARRLRLIDRPPAPLARLQSTLAPLHSFNSYGLFAVMTTTRPEIVIEGSADALTWLPYAFRYKPGDPARAPTFAGPHMPRLDWQMWFAALGDWRSNTWYLRFVARLLEGTPAVLGLLATDPFPDAPPRYIRSTLHQYRFTDRATRRSTGAWWERERSGAYSPTFELRDGELRPVPF